MIRSEISIGWIPNVAGRLSFSHIGKSTYPRRCAVENTGNSLGRRIVVAQARRLSDWLLPNWYFRALYGYSADWHFVLVARTGGDRFDHISRLEGEVLIFDKTDWGRTIDLPHGGGTAPADIVKSGLLAWARVPRSQSVDPLPEEALERLRSSALFSFAVRVRRSGVIWLRPLSFASDLVFADDYLSEPHTPRPAEIRHLANQVFFFMKDISHSHRHHHPGSDTITEVGPVDPRRTWAINTHYRIHRKVVEMRRSSDPEAFYGASGMLAYLGSLRKAVTNKAQREQARSALNFNNAEIEGSIKAETEVMKWRQTQKNITKTAFPALAIALISLGGYEEGTLGSHMRNFATEFYSKHPIYSLGALALLVTLAPLYYQIWNLGRASPVILAKRILVTRPVAVQGVFWFILSGFMFLSSALLLALQSILHAPWADWGRAHAQELSWLILAASAGISLMCIYLLPFWPTRHDAGHALRDWFNGLRRRY